MDMITLALAKKYTDEKMGGGSGLPHFNLAQMGLPTVTIGGIVFVNDNVDTTELRNAMLTSSVWLTMNVEMVGNVTALFNSAHAKEMSVVQATAIFDSGNPVFVTVIVGSIGIEVHTTPIVLNNG